MISLSGSRRCFLTIRSTRFKKFFYLCNIFMKSNELMYTATVKRVALCLSLYYSQVAELVDVVLRWFCRKGVTP